MLFQMSQSREEYNICVVLFIYFTFKIMPFPGIVQKKISLNCVIVNTITILQVKIAHKNSLLKDYHIKFPSFGKYQILKAT